MHATYNEDSDRLTIHDLNKDHYELLLTIFAFIGGSPSRSVRKYAQEIDDAIYSAMGACSPDFQQTFAYKSIDRSKPAVGIVFIDDPDAEKKAALDKLTAREKELLGLK